MLAGTMTAPEIKSKQPTFWAVRNVRLFCRLALLRCFCLNKEPGIVCSIAVHCEQLHTHLHTAALAMYVECENAKIEAFLGQDLCSKMEKPMHAHTG